MKRENPSWGAPRIHGELLLLGFDISEPTVSRYLKRLKRNPEESKAAQWLAFLNNHREAIAAFDFFTVPNLCFRTLYCFFVIEHGRRRILHFDVTFHPTSDWIVQQLREAFPPLANEPPKGVLAFKPESCPHPGWRSSPSLPLVGSSVKFAAKRLLMTHTSTRTATLTVTSSTAVRV